MLVHRNQKGRGLSGGGSPSHPFQVHIDAASLGIFNGGVDKARQVQAYHLIERPGPRLERVEVFKAPRERMGGKRPF